MEDGGSVRRQVPVLPEDVGGSQRRVAAQVHLDSRGEPPQIVLARPTAHQERRLRQVHLARDPLHPRRIRRPRQHADGGRIPPERLTGEGVDLHYRQTHASCSIVVSNPRKRFFALQLQPALLEEIRKVARAEGVAVDQLLNVAVAEKLSALRTENHFAERAARGDAADAHRNFERAGVGRPPVPGDEMS